MKKIVGYLVVFFTCIIVHCPVDAAGADFCE